MSEVIRGSEHKAKWMTISTDEYESLKSTLEVLSDPELMKQLEKSKDDIKKGRTTKWGDFIKELKSR